MYVCHILGVSHINKCNENTKFTPVAGNSSTELLKIQYIYCYRSQQVTTIYDGDEIILSKEHALCLCLSEDELE